MFAERLSKLREKMGLTQKEISNRLGMARTTYAGYENGKREPDLDTLIKFATFHDCSVDYLLGRTNNPTFEYSEEARDFIDRLDLTDESILDKFTFYYNGMPLTKAESLEFISIVRAIFDARKSLRESP